MTDLYHDSTRFYGALIVLTVAAIPAMPGMRPLNNPAFLQGGKSACACWTRLHFEVPGGTVLGHPCGQIMVVILLIGKDRDEPGKVLGRDEAKQGHGCHPIIETGAGNENGEDQAQRIDQQMVLASLNLLAAIIPALRSTHLGRLDRLTINARGAGGGGTPCGHASLLAQSRDHLGPGSVVAPLGKVVIHSTFRQQIVWQ